MDFINIAVNHLGGLMVYFALFLIGSVVMYFLSKLKKESAVALQVMIVIRALLSAKLGSKASLLIDIWIDGLKKIQDGEFSEDDRVDQFVRFVRLGASSKGVELSDSDVDNIRDLVNSTLDVFVGKKPNEINLAVNKFNKMTF